MHGIPSRPLCCALASEADVQRRIEKTRNVVRFFERLAPYDRRTFSAASLVWTCIADIPAERRVALLDVLNGRDLRRLWRISAERYDAEKETLTELAIYSPLDDLPEEPEEIVQFEGKAATLWGFVGWDRFTKLLFVEPETYEIHGRMLLRRVPLAETLYPLYFHVAPRQMRIPATGELSELVMEYSGAYDGPELTRESFPDAHWPVPRDPLFPFHGGVTEYLRPIGPGCYIGVGWREPRLEFSDIGRKFLTFLLVKIPIVS